MTREQAKEILNGMSLEDCIKMWNDNAVESYCRAIEIHEMDDENWWNWLTKELGGFWLMDFLLRSESTFNRRDMFFFYDENVNEFYSFDNKEEMFEIIGEWFIEEIINREDYE
jgi:hypothetical protein